MARPRKYTDAELVAALEATKGMVYLAAAQVGCSPDTIYDRAAKAPAVRAALRAERGKVVDTAELKLFQAILAGEPWAVRMCLMTLGKDRGYVEKPPAADPAAASKAGDTVELATRVLAAVGARLAVPGGGGGPPGGDPVGPEPGAAGGGPPQPG